MRYCGGISWSDEVASGVLGLGLLFSLVAGETSKLRREQVGSLHMGLLVSSVEAIDQDYRFDLHRNVDRLLLS